MEGDGEQRAATAVRVRRIHPAGFRNLADAEIELGFELTVLHGPNGAGKTNLLEALYFGLTGQTCRGGATRDAIRFDAPAARVELVLDGEEGERHTLLAGVARDGERRHLLDGKSAPAGIEGRPAAGVFLPERLQLVKGPPALRRAHLDRFAAAVWPARADLRSRFGRALAQRNALVSRVRGGLASASALPAWDEEVARTAEPLIAARREAAEVLAGPLARIGERLGLGSLTVEHRARAPGEAGAMAAELGRRREAGLGRAYTSFGPQLDELQLDLDSRPIRRFGSQGQQRLALLALLFAEREALIDAGRPAPLMLLDDVMSELDPDRRRHLVEWLAGAGQALLTATEPSQVPDCGARTLIAIRGGRATRLAEAA